MKKEQEKKVIGLIPARLNSHRFPDKLIREINGKSILQLVYEQCMKCSFLNDIFIVTGDLEIVDLARGFGARFFMSQSEHLCGSERCFEAVSQLGKFEVLMNIQADQPFINPEIIDHLAHSMLENPDVKIGSLMSHEVCDNSSLSTVKVLVDNNDHAHDFTRELHEEHVSHEHIGVYAFRNTIVKVIDKMPPSKNELEQSLEQLRWMDNGLRIRMFRVNDVPISINVPEDIDGLK